MRKTHQKKKRKKVRQNPKKAKNPVPTHLKMSKTHLIGHAKLTHQKSTHQKKTKKIIKPMHVYTVSEGPNVVRGRTASH
jgi:hypothetical protein